MEKTPEMEREVQERLAAIKKALGRIPVVNQVLSERADLFLPNADMSFALFMNSTVLDTKTKHLLALSAAAANGSPYCVQVQMEEAILCGATDEEILETLQISAYMGLTKVQSTAFRVYADVFDRKLE